MNQEGVCQITAGVTGCHLEGSLFWFDDLHSPEICLVSHFPKESLPSWGAKLMVSEDLAPLLGCVSQTFWRHNPVICPYGHPFSLGSYEIEFLPAGATLGCSSIRMTHQDFSLLYAPYAMPDREDVIRQTVLKPSDVLVLVASSPDLQLVYSSDQQQDLYGLAGRCDNFHKQHGFYPIIVCDELGCAQQIMKVFGECGLKLGVSRQIYNLSKLYRQAGVDLGTSWRCYQRKYFRDRVLLVSERSLHKIKLTSSFRQCVIAVTGQMSLYRHYKLHGGFDGLYYLNYESTVTDLKAVISEVNPQQIILTGPYIQGYSQALSLQDSEFTPAYPNRQPSLSDLRG